MGVRITGLDAVSFMIERDGDKAYRASLKAMDTKADELLKEARNNAPVDKYNLEKAIIRIPERGSGETRKTRGADGRFKAYTVMVGVLKPTITDKATGKAVNVEQYATIMEESDRAGQGSEENAKKRAKGGKPGRKYMERAYHTVDPTVVPEMIRKVNESI